MSVTHNFVNRLCKICGFDEDNDSDKFTCEKFLEICNSHKWIVDKYHWYYEFCCEICGITGQYRFNQEVVVINKPFDYYTCNEYLMIKVNE